MTTDNILEIFIDIDGRLCIKPERNRFTGIYRSAVEINWEKTGLYLYTPPPREWTYLQWYKHVIQTILSEDNCYLKVTDRTKWISIPQDLRDHISNLNKGDFT